jgi:hypothetical protein
VIIIAKFECAKEKLCLTEKVDQNGLKRRKEEVTKNNPCWLRTMGVVQEQA